MDELKNLRRTIDIIDETILQSFTSRMQISSQIGDFKKKNNQEISDPDREKQIQEKWLQAGKNYGLSEGFVTELLQLTLKNSKENQS